MDDLDLGEDKPGEENFEAWDKYFQEFIFKAYDGLVAVEPTSILTAYNTIESHLNDPLYIFGNGGSAAIASHFCVDYNKGISNDTNFKPKAFCLNDNIPSITAIANDSHYSYIFSQQLLTINPTKGLVIAISSSGNSPNIINGLAAANKLQIPSIAFVGFDGGNIKENKLANTIVHVPINNYGIVEDLHMFMLHAIIQRIRSKWNASGAALKL